MQSGDTIAVSTYGNEPAGFLANLHRIGERVRNVHLWTMLVMGNYPVMNDASLAGKIDIVTFFYNEYCRRGHQTGRFEMFPMNLHSMGAGTIEARKPNIFAASVSPVDENGNAIWDNVAKYTEEVEGGSGND